MSEVALHVTVLLQTEVRGEQLVCALLDDAEVDHDVALVACGVCAHLARGGVRRWGGTGRSGETGRCGEVGDTGRSHACAHLGEELGVALELGRQSLDGAGDSPDGRGEHLPRGTLRGERRGGHAGWACGVARGWGEGGMPRGTKGRRQGNRRCVCVCVHTL